MTRIALVTAIAAAGADDDLAPLLDACARAGLAAQVRAWDDPTVGWSRFDAAILRSPWDYVPRLREFLAAAAKRFRAVLIDTPAADEGPDLEIYAALASGALVVHGKGGRRAPLAALRRHLRTARARVVSVLVSG